MKATWEPHEKHGDLTERSDLPDSVFAFPAQHYGVNMSETDWRQLSSRPRARWE